jgi:hypothetical protein
VQKVVALCQDEINVTFAITKDIIGVQNQKKVVTTIMQFILNELRTCIGLKVRS